MMYEGPPQIQTFDDGSTLTTYADGSVRSTNAPIFFTDQVEASRLQPFSQDQRMPWWQSVAAYGVTRAIDTHFNNRSIPTGSIQPGYASDSGQTRSRNSAPPILQGNNLLLIGAAVVAAVLLAR
jgi:hypothetical protein